MQFTRKIQKDWRVVIPKYIREKLDLYTGDKVIFKTKNKQIIIKKLKE